jgi:hypothetical protein
MQRPPPGLEGSRLDLGLERLRHTGGALIPPVWFRQGGGQVTFVNLPPRTVTRPMHCGFESLTLVNLSAFPVSVKR